MSVPRTATPFRACLMLAAMLFTVTVHSAAQSRDGASPQAPASGELRIYLGMWTSHLKDLGRGLDNNWLVGFGWRGYYAGTFVNSYGRRAFAGGIQRTVARGEDGAVVPSLGYRLGFVTGYDERFMGIASRTPVLPLAQLVGDVEMGPTGIELAWAGLIASLGPNFRF